MRLFLRRTHARPLSAIATASTCVLLALQSGCGNVDRSTLAPLPSSPSATIAGSAHAPGGSGLQGVVVTLDGTTGLAVVIGVRDGCTRSREQHGKQCCGDRFHG